MTGRKPVRIAVLSDQHIDREHAPESWELAKHAFKTAVALGIDQVVLCGDTFDCATAMLDDRAAVRKYLKKVGLWSRDRLSVVVGNHEVFHTPHHRTGTAKALELARIVVTGDAADNVDAFFDWMGELVGDDDWLSEGPSAPYSKAIGHVRLIVADSTADETAYGRNGFWPEENDEAVRSVEVTAEERRVLAIHNAPKKAKTEGVLSYRFPAKDFERLRACVDDVDIGAVVCGHWHRFEGASARWRLGERCRVFLEGRTGGMWTSPSLGVLTVPTTGKIGWDDVEL